MRSSIFVLSLTYIFSFSVPLEVPETTSTTENIPTSIAPFELLRDILMDKLKLLFSRIATPFF